MYYIKENTNST